MNKKNFITVVLAAGIFLSPSLTGLAFSQDESSKCPWLEAVRNGANPQDAAKPGPLGKSNAMGLATPEQKRLEKTLRQNMQSSQALMRAAKRYGASNETLTQMGRLSSDFMKLFADTIEKAQAARPAQPNARPQQPQARPATPGQPQARLLPVRPAPHGQQPAPGAVPPGMAKPGQQSQQFPGLPPEGFIVTTPDGAQWLVMPQQPQQGQQSQAAPQTRKPAVPGAPNIPPLPPASGDAQTAPQQPQGYGAQPLPEGVIIMEEETVSDLLPKWPTKDQYAAEGIMQYVEDLKAQKMGMPSPNAGTSAYNTPYGMIIVGEEVDEEKPEWPTKDQYATEGMMKYVQDLKNAKK